MMSNKLLIIISTSLVIITVAVFVFYDGHLNDMRESLVGESDVFRAIDSIKNELAEYKTKYEYAQSEYGVDIELTKTDSVWYIGSSDHNQADSAKILLKHFRNRLELIDSVWVIRIPPTD